MKEHHKLSSCTNKGRENACTCEKTKEHYLSTTEQHPCKATCEDEISLCVYTDIQSDFNISKNLRKKGTKYKEKGKETYKPSSNFIIFFNQLCSDIQGRNISIGLYVAGQSEKHLSSFLIKISYIYVFLHALILKKKKKKWK